MTSPDFLQASSETLASLPSPVLSRQRLDGLQDVARALHETMPEYTGMTAFGSTVRGEAREDSDLDICVFVNAGDNEGSIEAHSSTDPELAETYIVTNPLEASGISYRVKKEMEARNLPGRSSDVEIVPINHDIVADTTEILMANAVKLKEGDTSIRIPRNVRELFYAAIDTANLQPYIEQALRVLSNDVRGEEGWHLIRGAVEYYENKRGEQGQPLRHRYFPVNLEEARGYYLHEQ